MEALKTLVESRAHQREKNLSQVNHTSQHHADEALEQRPASPILAKGISLIPIHVCIKQPQSTTDRSSLIRFF